MVSISNNNVTVKGLVMSVNLQHFSESLSAIELDIDTIVNAINAVNPNRRKMQACLRTMLLDDFIQASSVLGRLQKQIVKHGILIEDMIMELDQLRNIKDFIAKKQNEANEAIHENQYHPYEKNC
jgi:hypothetical protein